MTTIKLILKIILYKPLFNIFAVLLLLPGHNVGVTIVILTILIRLILLPSTANSTKMQKKLKDLQPEIDKIKEKYKDDQQAQAKATMEFYQVNKINPFSSCLPLLVQLSILLVLYYVFRNVLTLDRYPELLYSFTPHLTNPADLHTIFLGINLANPSIPLAIITGLLQFWQTKQITPEMPKTQQKNNDNGLQSALGNQMLYLMPIFTVIIALKLPAALPLYWCVTTLFMIGQQHFIFKNNKVDLKGVSVQVKTKS